ncbi:MAG: hypothetical protein JNJ94_01145 [Chlorobi bacterium]|nr:hypothetical protein [Chlorobiota bacterium]
MSINIVSINIVSINIVSINIVSVSIMRKLSYVLGILVALQAAPLLRAQPAATSSSAPALRPGAIMGVNYSPASPGGFSVDLNVVTKSGIIGGLEVGGLFNGIKRPAHKSTTAPNSNVTSLGWFQNSELFLTLGGGISSGNFYAMYNAGVTQQRRFFLVEDNVTKVVYENQSEANYHFMHGIDLSYIADNQWKASIGYFTLRKWVVGVGYKF